LKEKLPDIYISNYTIKKESYISAVEKAFSTIVVEQNNHLDDYVGRKIFIGDKTSVVNAIEHINSN
jgi:hypothetical protein